MKSLRNKVILSGIVLLFAFMATVGSTYAWFTVSSSTEVESMNLQVTAAENLAIMPWDSTEDYTTDDNSNGIPDFLENIANYSSSVSLAELQAAGYATDTWKMQPATAVSIGYAGIDGKLLNKIDDARALTSVGSTEGTNFNAASGYYIQLKFWVYSQAEADRSLRLNDFAISAVDQVATREDVVDAVRLSVWADDSDYGVTGSEGSAIIFGETDLFDFSYLGTTGEISGNNTLDQASTAVTGSVTSAGLADSVYTNAELASAGDLLSIESNIPTLVTVNIFIEGWHSDAANNVADANFDIEFSFIIN